VIIFDVVLTGFISILNVIAYALEPYRGLILFLGIIYCIALASQLILAIFQIKNRKTPVGSIITLVFSVFLNNDSVNSHYRMILEKKPALNTLIVILICAIILTLFLFFSNTETKKIKDFIIIFFVNLLLCGCIALFEVLPLVNYTFDLSETEEICVVIDSFSEEENFRGAPFDHHSIYYVSCDEKYSISQISIDDDYGRFEIGESVLLNYRKGIFFNIYKVDYSKLQKP